jgi:hypothetical protein
MLYPAPDGDMIYRNSALCYHLFQIAVAQRIPQVPPHAQNDDDVVKVSPSERRWSGPAHRITLPEDPEPFATDPFATHASVLWRRKTAAGRSRLKERNVRSAGIGVDSSSIGQKIGGRVEVALKLHYAWQGV